MALLAVENLQTYFSSGGKTVRAVDGVSFQMEPGEFLGLVGESGCGKTTTALSLMRLLPKGGRIAGGRIDFNGQVVTELSDEALRRFRWKEISVVFQGAMNALNPVQRVGDQIAEAIMLHEQVEQAEAITRVKRLLELVEIEGRRAKEYPHEFSGGMRQRVMIAMALALNPKLVIGDEPTTALDVMVQAQIFQLIERLRQEFNLSMIIITHDLSVLGDVCDRVAVMYAGQLVEIGKIEDIFRQPGHPYTQRLLAAFPHIGGSRLMPAAIAGNPPDLTEEIVGCRFAPRCQCVGAACQEGPPPLCDLGNGHQIFCHRGGEVVD
jgi:peptide/nickel transport system ATP-binding protein